MAPFDGLGIVGSDKQTVVLDIGEAYTKCGFASELAPRAVVPSVVEELLADGTLGRTPVFQRDDGTVRRSAEQQHSLLKKFIYQIYYKHLLAVPKERRCVVVESVLASTVARDQLASVLLEALEVPSVVFAPAHLLAVFPLRYQHALVVDVGHRETLVVPVYEGVAMLNCWETTPLAGAAVGERLRSELLATAQVVSSQLGVVPLAECPQLLTDVILNDVQVRCCFVTLLARGEKYQAKARGQAAEDEPQLETPAPPPDVKYPIDGDTTLIVPGALRESVFEALFERDNDVKSVAQVILDSILRCPIDLRKFMAEHLLVTGGTAMTRGFLARLKAELLALLASDRYRARLPLTCVKFMLRDAAQYRYENCLPWLGGEFMAEHLLVTGGMAMARCFLARLKVELMALLASDCYRARLPLTCVKFMLRDAAQYRYENCLPWLGGECMAEHLLVTGGTAMTRGFLARLKAELLALLASDRYRAQLPLTCVKFMRRDAAQYRYENCLPWLGGEFMAEHLLVTGGTAMTRGFLARLKAELLALFASDRYRARLPLTCVKFMLRDAAQYRYKNCLPWLGGEWMAEHLLVTGGTAMTCGFLARLKAELLALLASDRYRARLPLTCVKFMLRDAAQYQYENCLPWLGGSLFGALEVLPYRSLTREQFAQTHTVPDWTAAIADCTGVDADVNHQRATADVPHKRPASGAAASAIEQRRRN